MAKTKPAPESPAPDLDQAPAAGGSYVRNPDTGELSPAGSAPIPAAPLPAAPASQE